MKADKVLATYARLRTQPLWRLLAADHGPIIISLLQVHFLEGEKSLPASILHERLGRDLEDLRARGEDLPQTAQAYVADWLANGYLERRFRAGAAEEEYELSTAAANAVRFAMSLVESRTAATESRLAIVIHHLVQLAEETDPNPDARIAALRHEQVRIERQIDAIREGRLSSLPDARALERARDIMALADDLSADFRRVRDEFEHLHRTLRERLMDYDGSRGDVLEALFNGVDVIGDSDAGRTFAAFWALLTDPEESTALEQALDDVLCRPFAGALNIKERRFLLGLTRRLLEEGGMVHGVPAELREKPETLRAESRIPRTTASQPSSERCAAHGASAERGGQGDSVCSTRTATHQRRVRSISQWALYDPSLRAPSRGMGESDEAQIDLEGLSDLIAQSEIDFRRLEENIRAVLSQRPQASHR